MTEVALLKKKIKELEEENKKLKGSEEENPDLSFELVEMYDVEEQNLIKLFMNNLPLTMSEEEKYGVILNTFYNLEQECEKFHKELRLLLVEHLEKREKKIFPLSSHGTTDSVMKSFSILYFLLQKSQIVKRVVRRTKLENSDYLKRYLEKCNILDIIYTFFRTNVRFDDGDKLLKGKMFQESSHKRYGSCKGHLILYCLSPSLFEKSQGEVVKEAVVITKEAEKKAGGGMMMMMMKKPGGLGGRPRLGGLVGKGNPVLAKAVTSFNLGAKLVETSKTKEFDMKKRESALKVKEEKMKRKEERLKLIEEDLKKKEEALSFFENDLKKKEKETFDAEEKKKVIDELERKKKARLEKRISNLKDFQEHIPKKPRSGTTFQTISTASSSQKPVRKKLSAKAVEEEESSCPRKTDDIVSEFMEIKLKFSGISEQHYSIANSEENIEKNRYRNILPYNHNYVRIGKKGYVNASECVIGNDTYYATQWPLINEEVNCLDDFWAMVYEKKSKVIVSLQKPSEKEFFTYWPKNEGEMKVTKNYVVKNVSVEHVGMNYQEIKIHIMKRKKGGLSFLKKKDVSKYIETTIFIYPKWPEKDLPDDFDSLCNIMVRADRILINRDNYVKISIGKKTVMGISPMIVHCSGGIGRTGAFVLCHYLFRNKRGIQFIKNTFYTLVKLRNRFIDDPSFYRYVYDFIWKYENNNFIFSV